MDEAREPAQSGWRAGGAKRGGVGLALVAERVERGGHDERRRKPGQVRGEQRRRAGIVCLRALGPEVVVLEPVHLGVREQEAVGEQIAGAAPGGEVGHRVDQQLEHGRRAAVARRQLRHHRGEVTAGAVAADADAAWIGAQPLSVRVGPAERGSGVVDRRGKRVLGRKAVVDREHVRAGVAAEDPAHAVVRIEVAVEEAAPVVVHEQRVRSAGLGRCVVPCAERGRGVDLEVLDGADGERFAAEHRGQPAPRLARVGQRHRLERRLLAALEDREHELSLGGERLAVDHDRRLAGQANLDPAGARRAPARPTAGRARSAWIGRRGWARGDPTRRVPAWSQLTAERENTRIEIAVSAAANSATTARLSHASVVTLPMPQISCSPLPDGSTSA